jgi:hypothetical protein
MTLLPEVESVLLEAVRRDQKRRTDNGAVRVARQRPDRRRFVASLADPRLPSRRRRAGAIQRWRGQHTRRGRRIAVAVVVVVTLSGAAGIKAILGPSQFAHVTALTLFSGSASDSSQHHGVIPASVKLLETIQIPGFGALQYWVGQTTSGDWCAALRLPDRVWAGYTNDPKYNYGGIVELPRGPSRCNSPASGESAGPHFTYYNSVFSSKTNARAHPRDRSWTVAYGIVRNLKGAVRVRDATTSVSTPVLDGHDFALLIPNHLVLGRDTPGGCSCGPHTKIWYAGPFRLEALNTAGKVIARATVEP